MIACSVIIVLGIIKSTKNLPNQSTYRKTVKHVEKNTFKTSEKPSAGNSLKDRAECQVKFMPNDQQKDSSENKQSSRFKTKKTNASMTKRKGGGGASKAKNVSSMLAANNIVFICFTLPIVVFQSLGYDGSWFRDPTICDLKKAQIRLIKVICIILMNTNCSINIFIYSVMSSEFKRTLFAVTNRMFCCARNDSSLLGSSRSGMSGSIKRPMSRSAIL
jgi:hypothetical protein